MPVICDMSSEFCSTKVDWDKYAVVYAGAQKNVGPAGVTMVIVREDMLNKSRKDTPLMFDWTILDKAMTGFQNTPCCWAIYMCGLNLSYMRSRGMDAINEEARAKSGALYKYIDESDGFYQNLVEEQYRSHMNIAFRVNCDEALETKFVKEGAEANLTDLKGHRSVGGCRASFYNAMPMEGV